jgi:hypothetical protein
VTLRRFVRNIVFLILIVWTIQIGVAIACAYLSISPWPWLAIVMLFVGGGLIVAVVGLLVVKTKWFIP